METRVWRIGHERADRYERGAQAERAGHREAGEGGAFGHERAGVPQRSNKKTSGDTRASPDWR